MRNDGYCFQSIRQIAARANLSELTVKRKLASAVKGGWITVTREKYRNNSYKNNRYQAVIPKKLRGVVSEVTHPEQGAMRMYPRLPTLVNLRSKRWYQRFTLITNIITKKITRENRSEPPYRVPPIFLKQRPESQTALRTVISQKIL